MKLHTLAAAMAFAVLAIAGPAQAEGNLASNATRLPDLSINSDDLTFSQTTFQLETGKYYRLRIVHDGGEELAVVAFVPVIVYNSSSLRRHLRVLAIHSRAFR